METFSWARLAEAANDYLLEAARALFAHCFEDYGRWDGLRPESWVSCTLGEHVIVKRGGSPRPIQDYLSGEGHRWLKVSDVTSEPSHYILSIKEHIRPQGIDKTILLNEGSLVLSNSATPGIPKNLDLDTCIHDGWLYFPSSELSNEWLYLYFMSQRERLVSLANGSVFKNLKIDIVKNFDLVMPDNGTLRSFQSIVQPLFDSMPNCARENRRLAELRDALLPRLMSGEIDVSQIKLPTQPNNHFAISILRIKPDNREHEKELESGRPGLATCEKVPRVWSGPARKHAECGSLRDNPADFARKPAECGPLPIMRNGHEYLFRRNPR